MMKRKNKNVFNVDIENVKSKSIINALNHLEEKPNSFEINEPATNNKRKKIIETKNLTKSFGTKTVLNNLNLDIYEGENVAFLGGNGAGKTTLVEILAGLNKPTSGEINYLFDFKKSFQEKIGIQFQDSSYPPAISCKEVIKFMVNIYGSKMNKDEMNALIKIFGIDEYYNKRASKLSGGQQQRLNVLLALLHKPHIIFLDELSTGLDIQIRTRIKNFIKEYAIENNMTIILVSHDMVEVKQLCKKIIFLKDGKIVINDLISNILEKNDNIEDFVFSLL
ncbi:ABC transporter ATP-binding protein [Mesomycoplasma moatsii]|uniref:ABC transporter ATP-binding protein n=1 Tax=Mesomycoplasma moatsii TaxID=171287 RepID=UPI0003B3EC75